MASIGSITADVDVQLTGSAVRVRALELALENSRNGLPFASILETAKQFADFISEGKMPDPK